MPTKKKKKSPWVVLIAIAFAILIGTWTGKEAGIFGVSFYSIFDVGGKLFLNSLTLSWTPDAVCQPALIAAKDNPPTDVMRLKVPKQPGV